MKLDLIRKYKFYFSFENSNTKGYLTEKTFECLESGTVPVIMTHPYNLKYIPRGSYISVHKYNSPKELAEYLLYLDKNDTAYKEYFKWRTDKEVLEEWVDNLTPASSLSCKILELFLQRENGFIPSKNVNVSELESNILPRDVFFKN